MSFVQSDGTNLAVVEQTVEATLPSTGWFNLDPNTYGGVGPSFKHEARRPISRNLQLEKGMLTDADSGLSIEVDLTKGVFDRFGDGMFRSKRKHSGGTGVSSFAVTGVTSTGYTVAANGNLQQRTLVYARGFNTPANNGLKLVGASSTGIEIKVSGLVVEASPPANATVEVAGFRFATSDAVLDADGNITTTTADFTTMGLGVGQWIVCGGREDDEIFSFVDENYRGAAKITAIAAHKLTLERRTFAVESVAFLDLAALTTTLETVIEARERGPDGNDITIAIVADAGTAAGSVSEVGSAVTFHIKTSATATTVAQFEALVAQSTLVQVRTADSTGTDALVGGDVIGATALDHGDEVQETGTGQTVEIYFTAWWRNVPLGHTDFRKTQYGFEVEWPELAEDGIASEYEYLLFNGLTKTTLNFPLTGKATVNLEFVGTRSLNPTPTRRSGPSAALDPNASTGLSTSTDLQRLRVTDVDEIGITTDFTSMKVMIDNHIAVQKQLGRLGGRFLTHGDHEVMTEAEALFTSSSVIAKVKANATVAQDILARNEDFGALFDQSALTLDTADRKIAKNQSVIVGSKATGFRKGISTDSLSIFAFLPALPEEEQ